MKTSTLKYYSVAMALLILLLMSGYYAAQKGFVGMVIIWFLYAVIWFTYSNQAIELEKKDRLIEAYRLANAIYKNEEEQKETRANITNSSQSAYIARCEQGATVGLAR